jgi:predicted deacylase
MQMPDIATEIRTVSEFNLDDTPKASIKYHWLEIITDGMSNPVSIPLIVARGAYDGPILGLTAAVHGNEINGVQVIQRLFTEIDVNELKGTIIGVPVVNVPSFLLRKRRFNDGVDLNHIMPGKKDGNLSQIYAYRFFNKLVKNFDYLLDLHTASFGRVNSYYIRADMNHPVTKELALIQNADIIVHNPPLDGTLRGAADAIDIPAITMEVGSPNTFQKRMIKGGVEGIHNVLYYLKMMDVELIIAKKETVLCERSYWLYTDLGGLLSLRVELLDMVTKGQPIGIIKDIFGQHLEEYYAPESGIVIGKSVSPVNQTGGRILHLGIVKEN